MEATKYWKESGISFKPMAITFYVTKSHIICAITELLDWNHVVAKQDHGEPVLKEKKITKKRVMDEIRSNLIDRGSVWEEYHGDNHYSDELYKEAETIGKRLFPSFWEIYKKTETAA